MADETTNTPVATPDAATAAPPAPPATPDAAAAPAAAAVPSTQTPDPRLAQEANAAIAARQQAEKIAAEPTAAPAPGPHATLARMVDNLMTGLGALGSSIATHGKEGGPEEVQRIRASQQEQQIQAQKAREDSKNQRLQQQIMVAQTHEANFQNILNLQTLPDELTLRHVNALAAQTGLASEQFQLFANTGLTPAQISGLVSGGTPDAKTAPILQANAAQQLRIASRLLPADNPALANLKTVLEKDAPVGDVIRAGITLEKELKGQEQITDAQKKYAEAAAVAPMGDRAPQLNALNLSRLQVLSPDMKALPTEYQITADSLPSDVDRIEKAIKGTEDAKATAEQRKATLALREQTLKLSGLGPVAGDVTKSGKEYLDTLPPGDRATVNEIGIGKMAPERIAQLLTRNPRIMDEVALAFPDFDSSKAAAYPDLYKKFAGGTIGTQLNSGNTALGHMAELVKLNTWDSHIPHTPAWTAYTNKVDTLATELAGFYGDTTVPAIDAIKKTLGSTLPGNRMAAIRTQAQSMGDKFDSFANQWAAGAPSAAYKPPMPGLSEKAQEARAILSGTASAPKVPPPGTPTGSVLMQVPGYDPVWVHPENLDKAKAAGGVEVK